MTSIIAVLVVLALLGLMAYAGYRDGAFMSTYALLRDLIAFLCAMTFCQPLAHALAFISETYPAYDYFVPLSFGAVFSAVYLFGRWLKVKYTAVQVECPFLVDRGAGAILGILHGIVVTGTLLILWTLFPFVKYVPADYGHMRPRVDTGVAMLRFYSFTEQRMGGRTVFLLEDEPMKVDQNENGRPDLLGEEFVDKNGNGKWDRGWLWKYRNHATIDPACLEPLNLPPPGSVPVP